MKHDPNGPSKLNQREECPGSFRLETTAEIEVRPEWAGPGTPDDESEASARGTRLHDLIADCIRCDRAPKLEDIPGADPESDLIPLEFCWEQAQKVLADVGEDLLVLVEYKVDLAHLGIPGGGTIDLAVVNPGKDFVLIDWKFGYSAVRDPAVNRQMQAYALGLANDYGCVEGNAIIVQPNGIGVAPVRSAYYSPEMLARLLPSLQRIVSDTQREDAPLIPGDHCLYCKVKTGCPARKAQADAVLARRAQPILHTIAAMEPKHRLDYIERMKLAKGWLESSLDEIDGAILDGRVQVPGLVVGEGRKSRDWVNEYMAAEAMTAAGIPEDRQFKRKVISPAEAEKIAGKSKSTGLKLRPAIVVVPGKPRIVREGTTGAIESEA